MQATATTPNPNQQQTILTSRIKVLHIISGDLWAGAETQAFTLIIALKDTCEVVVALMNHGELEQRLKNTGVNVTVIDERMTSSINIARQLAELIKGFEPNVIHTHRQKENILGSIANLIASKSMFRRVKSVRTTHGAPEHRASGLKKLIIWLDIFCGKYLQDAVISVSHDLERQLHKVFPAGKVHVIQNGIDIDSLRKLSPAVDIRENFHDHVHIGIVGRLEPVKRVDLFIHAAHHLITQHSERRIRFHIIGDGGLRSGLMSLAQQLDLAGHITFHGHRSDSTRAIAAMDLVVMCSDHEGTPMTALETLALGKPLIAHDVGGLREILDAYPELRVCDHTSAGYSSRILHLLRHPVDMKLNDRYTSQQNSAKTFALYRKLILPHVE